VSRMLASLNLSKFEDQVKGLGVETVADLKYVTEADLREMKMTVIQCRKFAELSGSALATCVGATLAITDVSAKTVGSVPAKVHDIRPRSRSREKPGGAPPQQQAKENGSGQNSWKDSQSNGDSKAPSWKNKGESGGSKSSWKDKHHNSGHKSWKDAQDGHKPAWKDSQVDDGWKNAPWDGVWKEPGWKAEQGSNGDSKWKDGGDNSSGKPTWKDEKPNWGGSWKDEKSWKKSKSSWKEGAAESDAQANQAPASQPQTDQPDKAVVELAPKASPENFHAPKQQAAFVAQGAASKGGGHHGGLLVAKAGSAKAAVHVVHTPGRSAAIAAPPPETMLALPQLPPAPVVTQSALGALGNDEVFKFAETLLKQNGQRKFYWEEVSQLKVAFKFSERIELGLKLLEPTKLNALLRENGNLHKLLEEAKDKDDVIRSLIKKHDPHVDQIVTQLEAKELEINGPR